MNYGWVNNYIPKSLHNAHKNGQTGSKLMPRTQWNELLLSQIIIYQKLYVTCTSVDEWMIHIPDMFPNQRMLVRVQTWLLEVQNSKDSELWLFCLKWGISNEIKWGIQFTYMLLNQWISVRV